MADYQNEFMRLLKEPVSQGNLLVFEAQLGGSQAGQYIFGQQHRHAEAAGPL